MTGSISEQDTPVSREHKVEVEHNDPSVQELTKIEGPRNPEKSRTREKISKDPKMKYNEQRRNSSDLRKGDHCGFMENIENLSLSTMFETPEIEWKDHTSENLMWEDENAIESLTREENKSSGKQENRMPEDEKEIIQEYIGDMACLLPEPRLFVNLLLEDKIKVPALVDTGADLSMISEELVESLGLKTDPTRAITIHGMGRTESGLGRVLLNIKICNNVLKPTVFQVIRGMKRTQVWLGRDFFGSHKFIVDYITKKLKQRRADGSNWEIYIGDDHRGNHLEHARIPVRVIETIKLEPDQAKRVEVAWEQVGECENNCWYCTEAGERELYFEPDLSNENINVNPGILDRDNGRVLITKADQGRGDKIKKGTVVGWVSPIVEVEKCYKVGFAVDGEDKERRSKWSPQDVIEKIELGEHLTENQKKEVQEMLMNNIEALSDGDTDIGRASITAHRIELYDYTPIRIKPRRLPEPVVKDVENQCKELNLLDIIEPSKSPWSAPIVPIRKKDGSIRLCVDYRKLNEVTVPDRFPMPNVTDVLAGLKGVKYFTCLDLVRGYYQMGIEPESREITAFSTPHGHWQFKRLPFGLKNAPSAFQREMQEVLKGFSWKNVLVYIDDILIMEESWEKHLQLVDQVLKTLAKHGIKIKPSKCEWVKKEVKFLGHLIGQRGVRKTPQYIVAIRDFQKPTTVRGMREFLGVINFQRKFLPKCAELSKPLSQVTGGPSRNDIEWNPEMEKAFEDLKAEAVKDIELAYPDYSDQSEPLELYVDASGYGAGACLAQKQGEVTRVIGYASMSFSAAQQRYSTTEREIAAIRWGVKVMRPYLYGVHFRIFTDHRPLVYLQNMKLIDSRLARTLEDLSDYSYTIYYKPGVENIVADSLSRIPWGKIEDPEQIVPDQLPAGIMLIQKVEGGGDSLFESLMICLKEESEAFEELEIQELRRVLTEELKTIADKIGLKLNKELRKKLEVMKQPGQFPLIEVILAFSKIYRYQVWVHVGGPSPIVFEFGNNTEDPITRRIHLQQKAGIHFNPAKERKNFEINDIDLEKCTFKKILDKPKEKQTPKEEEVDYGEIKDLYLDMSLRKEEGFCFEVTIEEKSYRCLLDGGAEVSVIEESVFRGLPVEMQEKNLLDFDGPTECIGIHQNKSKILSMIQLPFSISGCYFPRYPFAVVEDGMLPCPVVLGMNFVKRVMVDFDLGEIRWGEERILLHKFNEDHKNCVLWSVCLKLVDINQNESNSDTDCDLETYQRSVKTIDFQDVVMIQKRSPNIRQVKNIIETYGSSGQIPVRLKRFKPYLKYLTVSNDCLWHNDNSGRRPVIPFRIVTEFVVKAHYNAAHIGRKKLQQLVLREFWHPDLNKILSDVTNCCDWCQKNKAVQKPVIPPNVKIETNGPFDLVAVDLVTLPTTRTGFVACLVVVDHFSKWLSVIPIKDKRSETVAKMMKSRVLPTLPCIPDRILSDNGPEFRGKEFEDLLEEAGIKHVFTTPYQPSSNGAVERVNRTVIQFLRGLSKDGSTWDSVLPKAVVIYNNTYHESIGRTPSQMIINVAHKVSPSPKINNNKEYWKIGNPNFLPHRVGDFVLKKIERSGRLNVHKLSEKFSGPYRVSKVQPNKVAYEVEDPEGRIIRSHFSQLRPYRAPPKYLDNLMLIEEEDTNKKPEEEYYSRLPVTCGGFGSLEDSSEDDDDDDPQEIKSDECRSRWTTRRRRISMETISFDSEDDEISKILIELEEEKATTKYQERESRRRKPQRILMTSSGSEDVIDDRRSRREKNKINKPLLILGGTADKMIIGQKNTTDDKSGHISTINEVPIDQSESVMSAFEGPHERDQQSWLENAEDWDYSDEEKDGSVKSSRLNGREETDNDMRPRSRSLENVLDALNSLGRAATELSNSMEGMLNERSNEEDRVTEACNDQIAPRLIQVTARLEEFRKTQELWRKREREDMIRRRRADSDPDFLGWSSTPLNSSLYEIEEVDEEVESRSKDADYVPEPRIARTIVTDPNLRPRTRAQGKVMDLPNVQGRALENKSNNTL